MRADAIAAGSTGAILRVQAFTASGSWTVPAGVTTVDVLVVGGGGGGGGTSASLGAPGGAGGAVVQRTLTVTPGGSVTVTIGAGGAGGAANTAGGVGGTTSVGSISALGGSGGYLGANDDTTNTPTQRRAGAGTGAAAYEALPSLQGTLSDATVPGAGGRVSYISSGTRGGHGGPPVNGFGAGGGAGAGGSTGSGGTAGSITGPGQGGDTTSQTARTAGAGNSGCGGGGAGASGSQTGANGGSGYAEIRWVA